ncbi:Heat shock hsp20 [hydrothermal vent metagenome]|uniref:Heat shock hsp20 n=1 Tax=hydrothermal vent metagenome TaxID=652676 RepID=A0A1W1CY66_9ZZZZ
MLNKKISLILLPLAVTLSLQANDSFMQDPFGDDIFKEMMQMQQNMDKMFERMHQRIQQRNTHQLSPVGIYSIQHNRQFIDKKDHYEFATRIPESKENQIDIHTENGMMTIVAKIIEKYEKKTTNSYSTSSSMRMYQESIPLPSDADESTISMNYVNKKLVISLKKKTKVKTKSHTVSVKKENNTTTQKIEVSDKSNMR